MEIVNYDAYLFVYFTGNAKNEEAIHFAISEDGYLFKALNGNRPVIDSEKISVTGGVRDPHIIRTADNSTFYLVATDMVSDLGWESNRGMVLLKSTDLLTWTSATVTIPERFEGHENLLRVWAPQTIYDPTEKKYMLYWSMKHGQEADMIYYAYANADFTDLATIPKQLFFEPHGHACIDGDIVFHNGLYHLFFKDHDEGNGLKKAVSDQLTTGYVLKEGYVQQTTDPVEGSCVYPLNNGEGYILMYDVYMNGRYQFTKSKDLKEFKVIDDQVSLNFHPRHGSVISITATEADRLIKSFGR